VLVTFKTTAYADITMFGDAAGALLKMMGQSGTIPGAIMGKDVGAAMNALKQELADQLEPNANDDANSAGHQTQGDDDENNNRVALATRAVPLLELLEAAAASGANVMWDT